jgi:hypothetical protein
MAHHDISRHKLSGAADIDGPFLGLPFLPEPFSLSSAWLSTIALFRPTSARKGPLRKPFLPRRELLTS